MLLSASLVVVLALRAAAAANDFSVTTEICVTKIRPGSTTLSSLPTCTTTSIITTTSVWTEFSNASTTTTSFIPAPITSTELLTESAVTPASESSPLETTTVRVTVTGHAVSNGTCSITKTTSAPPLSTAYTGHYDGNVPSQTAQAMSQSVAGMNKRELHQLGRPIDRFRADELNGTQQPYEVECVEMITIYRISSITVQPDVATETITAETSIVVLTSTETLPDSQSPLVTVTSFITVPAASSTRLSGTCTVYTGNPLPVTTQHIKCAPSNMISSVNGHGIDGAHGGAYALLPGGDPSACCQLCMDTEGCAAMVNAPAARNCFLYNHTSPSCGLAFTYTDSGKASLPGSKDWVQSGCGTIEPDVSS